MKIPWNTILIISSGGAFGGLVLGIGRNVTHRIQIPGGKKIEIGFLGDMLIGIAAAISVYSFADSLFNINLNNLNNETEFIKALAIAIISGFAGITILNKISSQLIEQVNKVSDKVETLETALKIQEYIAKGDFYRSINNFKEAILHYNHALEINPDNISALLSKGFSLKRINKVNDALKVVNKAFQINPNDHRVWYNRACYKAILNHSKEEIYSDLKKAISLFPDNKNLAKDDPDFQNISSEDEFIKITSN